MAEAARQNHWRYAGLISGLIMLLSAGVLYAMGRLPICACGTVKLWHGDVQSPGNSQHLTDWYSLSHVLHGLIVYALFHRLAALGWLRLSVPMRLVMAVFLEAGWEILENSPLIIERYRTVTVSLGYTGDSIVNSMSDIAMMILGFLFAMRAPVRASISMLIGFELLALWAIRDNLTLNILMLVYPLDAVRQWQAGV